VKAEPRINVYNLSRSELRQWLVDCDLNPIHAATVWSALYLDLVTSFDAMADVPGRIRGRLSEQFCIGILETAIETVSSDGFTRKYLLH